MAGMPPIAAVALAPAITTQSMGVMAGTRAKAAIEGIPATLDSTDDDRTAVGVGVPCAWLEADYQRHYSGKNKCPSAT